MFIYRPLLTQMSIRKGIGEMGVGTQLAPLVQHDSINGTYFVRDRQRIGKVDPKRGPGEFVKRMEAEHGELQSFMMKDRSIIKTVPEELVDGLAEGQLFDELQNASTEALNEIQYAHEKDVNDALWADDEAGFNSIYGASFVVTPSTKWDASGATIREDVLAGIDSNYKRTGFRPNTIVMPKVVINAIASDSSNEIAERLKYTSGRIPTAQLLAQYFDVQQVIIPQNLEDTTNAGQAASFDFMWDGDNVGIFYIDPSNTRNKMTLATTFYRDTQRKPFLGVFTRYNEDNESYEAKVHASYDVKLIEASAGYILFDVLG